MTATRPQPTQRYMELVSSFPLTEIQSDEHLDEANAVLQRLLSREADSDERLYINALASLIESYESVQFGEPTAQPHEFLGVLLRTNRLDVAHVAQEIGVEPSALASMRDGQRAFDDEVARRLGEYFAVAPHAFTAESPRAKPRRKHKPNSQQATVAGTSVREYGSNKALYLVWQAGDELFIQVCTENKAWRSLLLKNPSLRTLERKVKAEAEHNIRAAVHLGDIMRDYRSYFSVGKVRFVT